MMYQYDIHIIVSQVTRITTTIYILFCPEVESAQLTIKLDIAHFVHMIYKMSDRWPLCVLPRWSC